MVVFILGQALKTGVGIALISALLYLSIFLFAILLSLILCKSYEVQEQHM